MGNMYERIKNLCDERGLSGAALCKEVGLSRSAMTELKSGRTKTLSASATAKVADFFGVSVSYLLGNEEISSKEKAPALTKKDERDIAREMEKMKESLESGELLMFDGDPLSDEAKESILAAMRVGMEMAKQRNKEKYTPKKYKK